MRSLFQGVAGPLYRWYLHVAPSNGIRADTPAVWDSIQAAITPYPFS